MVAEVWGRQKHHEGKSFVIQGESKELELGKFPMPKASRGKGIK